MKNLRKEFPILSHNTYLNTAASGLLYNSLLQFRQQHDMDFLTGGSIFREHQQDHLASTRKMVATFFGNPETDVVLIPNFSLGFNTLLNGFDKSKKILLLKDDYPSINFAVENKGFEVCYTDIRDTLEEDIKNAIEKHQPDIFAFSLVQYTNGIAVDLDFIKFLKTQYPEMLLIADGTQFCGTTAFNFDTSGIDILGGSGYKWLLGGYGNGFMLFKPGILEQITPTSYINSPSKMIYDSSYTSLTARFECGHLDTLNFMSLQHSLNFISTIGISTIGRHLTELCNHALAEFTKLCLLDTSVVQRQKHSSIFNLKGDIKLYHYLKEQHIITSLRGQGIRVSFHFYNTLEDLEKLLTALHDYS